MCFFPSGSGLTVRRWSRALTPWSRRTARRNTTASSSLTCCCSAAPALTRRCSASALVATTWRARWRCAKTAYSRITPADVGVSGCGFCDTGAAWRSIWYLLNTHSVFSVAVWRGKHERWSYLLFSQLLSQTEHHVIHQQHRVNKGRCLSSRISHVGSLHISTCTCLQVHCSSDTTTPPCCPIHLFLKLSSLGRITLDWHTEGPHTHTGRGLRRTQFYTVTKDFSLVDRRRVDM